MESSPDYIVVGGGSAGCVVASRLAEEPGAEVLLLEAGSSDYSPAIHLPVGLLRMSSKNYWNLLTEPDPTRNGRREMWRQGKVLGGGSSINGMTWVRGNPADFDSWAHASGCVGWDYDSLLPFMKALESFEGGGSEVRGDGGPQSVAESHVDHPLTNRFISAASQAGFPHLRDYNGTQQLGVGKAQLSQRRGMRHNTARAYLPAVRRGRGLRLVTGAVVRRVVFEGLRAVAVEYDVKGTRHQVRASREIILTAGALSTPALLQRSGVGPSQTLASAGIPLVADRAGVGANLQEHPCAFMKFEVRESTLNQEMSLAAATRAALELITRGRGLATSTLCHATAFGRLDGTLLGAPDFQLMFGPYGMDSSLRDPGTGHDKQRVKLARTATVTVYVALLHPEARGTVSVTSSDPAGQPRIEFEMFQSDADLKALTEACRRTRDIFRAEGLAECVIGESLPGPSVQTDDEWVNYLRHTSVGGAHPAGTCRMGGDQDSVVDPELRVRGVDGLRVADASIMPTLTSGNTNATVILIAEKAAACIGG